MEFAFDELSKFSTYGIPENETRDNLISFLTSACLRYQEKPGFSKIFTIHSFATFQKYLSLEGPTLTMDNIHTTIGILFHSFINDKENIDRYSLCFSMYMMVITKDLFGSLLKAIPMTSNGGLIDITKDT